MFKPNKIFRIVEPSEFSANLLFMPSPLPTVYLVEQKRGRAYSEENCIAVPLWAEDKGREVFLYYIAHELAHIVSKSHYHKMPFYKAFLKICPEHLQHYELEYKPSAIGFGIKR